MENVDTEYCERNFVWNYIIIHLQGNNELEMIHIYLQCRLWIPVKFWMGSNLSKRKELQWPDEGVYSVKSWEEQLEGLESSRREGMETYESSSEAGALTLGLYACF